MAAAGRRPVFFFIAILIPHLLSSHLVNGDAALKQTTCAKTKLPAACAACFDSTPGTDGQDLKGLAASTVSCALAKSAAAERLLSSYVGNVTVAAPERDPHATCEKKLGSATGKVTAALRLCRAGSYVGSRDLLESAARDGADCREVWVGGGEVLPPAGFLSGLRDFDVYADVASGTVAQLILPKLGSPSEPHYIRVNL
ncbi:unnamed protein product [Linum trigynum]|uniref:Pectinesterase inhibitor domain-containing protein n=1 Tax=Linum trigynum TaxID=586398 RepID=A0AAV2EXJ4_9ROSI